VSDFKQVKKANPCPICGKHDWCGRTAEEVVKCERVSEAPPGWFRMSVKDGGGVFRPDRDARDGPPPPKAPAPRATGRKAKTPGKATSSYRDAGAAQAAAERSVGRAADHAWPYVDRGGEPVGLVLRWDARGKTPKTLRHLRADPDGWRCKAPDGPRPLLYLPEMLADPDAAVYVVEGETTADAARALGLLATTNAGGASAWSKTDCGPLAGRDVVVLPDHDDPGDAYAENVTTDLLALDPPARVRVVRLVDGWPELPKKGDLADVVAAHAGKLDAVQAILAELVQATTPPPACGPVLLGFDDIEPEDVRWLWPGRIAEGRLTTLAGAAGLGKSYLTAELAATVSNGRPWPDGTPCPRGSVLMLCAEDDPKDTTLPRLIAQDADRAKVKALTAVRVPGNNGKPAEKVVTLADLDTIAEALDALPDCRLVVVDPIGSYMGGGVDTHKDNDTRAVLAPLVELARQRGVAVLAVAHLRKSAVTAADDAVMGSRAFTALARVVLHLVADPDDEPAEGEDRDARRLLVSGKNNLARKADGLAFDIRGPGSGRLEWDTAPVTATAEDLYARQRTGAGGGNPTAKDEAEAWLGDTLADGARPAAELKAQAKADGISESTLKRAKASLGVLAKREGFSKDGRWTWALPPGPAGPKGTNAGEREPLAPYDDLAPYEPDAPETGPDAAPPDPPPPKGGQGSSSRDADPQSPGPGEGVEL